jgi:hypothetical protein
MRIFTDFPHHLLTRMQRQRLVVHGGASLSRTTDLCLLLWFRTSCSLLGCFGVGNGGGGDKSDSVLVVTVLVSILVVVVTDLVLVVAVLVSILVVVVTDLVSVLVVVVVTGYSSDEAEVLGLFWIWR